MAAHVTLLLCYSDFGFPRLTSFETVMGKKLKTAPDLTLLFEGRHALAIGWVLAFEACIRDQGKRQ